MIINYTKVIMTYLCYDIQHVILQYCRIKDITNMSLICDVYNELCNEILLFNTNDIIDTDLNILVITNKYYDKEISDNVFFNLIKFKKYMKNINNITHKETVEHTIELQTINKTGNTKIIKKQIHGILTFTTEKKYIACKYNDDKLLVRRFIQRDKNAVLNFKFLTDYYLNNRQRPIEFKSCYRVKKQIVGCKPTNIC